MYIMLYVHIRIYVYTSYTYIYIYIHIHVCIKNYPPTSGSKQFGSQTAGLAEAQGTLGVRWGRVLLRACNGPRLGQHALKHLGILVTVFGYLP